MVALVRIREGVDFRKWRTVYFLEARLAPDRPWLLVTDGEHWHPHFDREDAVKEAVSIGKTLRRKCPRRANS